MSDSSSKDVWDKVQVSAPLVASLLVPLAVVFVGSAYTKSVKDSENSVKYVELAISILRASPSEESAPLREWAVDVLKHEAVVPLSPQAQAQLKLQKLDVGYGDSYSYNSYYTTPSPTVKRK